ncbi:DUF6980 family protein [Streptomyces sp. NPDC012637]|uniref:DUF6980 family protein n=1 Tax=Streptomyces sp. NPDC012637 TaxID=3364842 RepID=UPI0036E9EC93
MGFSAKFQEYRLISHEDGTSSITIDCCPWCGRARPAAGPWLAGGVPEWHPSAGQHAPWVGKQGEQVQGPREHRVGKLKAVADIS